METVATPEPSGGSARSARTALEAAFDFACARGRPAAVYFLPQDEPIGTPNVTELAEAIGDREFGELDLVIHSSGGDIHAAYQLVTFLRRRARKLNACVPRYARSAATLLAVGADSIVLDELAALGPLDSQIFTGYTDNGQPDYKSALNQFKSLERLRTFSLESLRAAAEMLYSHEVRKAEDVLSYGMEFVRATAGPLFGKIESHKLGDYSQSLAIGEEYGRRLLRRLTDLSQAQREEIVQRLVHGYPSHEYVIDCDELADLGLDAELFEGKERHAARELSRHQSFRLVRVVDNLEPPDWDDLPDAVPWQDQELRQPAAQVHSGSIGPAPSNPWADPGGTKAPVQRSRP